MEISQIPFFAPLTKLELARLVPEVQYVEMQPDQCLSHPDQPCVWFVVRGEIEVLNEEGLSVIVVREGEMAGEWAMAHDWPVSWTLRAVSEVLLAQLPAERFQALLRQNEGFATLFRQTLVHRNTQVLGEMAQVRRAFTAYASEVWGEVPTPTSAALEQRFPERFSSAHAVREAQAIQHGDPPRPLPRRRRWSGWNWVVALVGTLLGVGIALGPGSGAAPDPVQGGLGLLLAAAINWVAGAVPDYAVALALTLGAVLLGLAAPAQAFAGFASPQWFLLLSIWAVGAAVHRSGLLYRLALHMLRVFPPTYAGQSLALALSGLAVTPLLPNVQSRVVMVAPLVKELGSVLGLRRGSKGMAGLAMAAITGFGLMYFQFSNGSTLPILAWSLMPAVWQERVSWVFWLLAALPLGVVVLLGSYLAVRWQFRPEQAIRVSREVVSSQLRVLGPMSRAERVTALVLAAVLVSFVLANWTGLAPAWAALTGMLVLVATGALDKTTLRRSVDWGFLLFFGAVMSFAGVLQDLGMDRYLQETISHHVGNLTADPVFFLALVSLVTLGVRLFVPAVQAVPLLVLVFTPMAVGLGYSPLVSNLAILTIGTNFLVPQQNPFYMALHAGMDEAFSHRDALRFALIHLLLIAVGLCLSLPLWRLLGLIPW